MPAPGLLSHARPDPPTSRAPSCSPRICRGRDTFSPTKAYDADHWRARLLRHNIQPVIPNKVNRKQPHPFDRERYKDRNTIERMFGRLKDFRRIATRYDKKAENFLAGLCLAALICYWI